MNRDLIVSSSATGLEIALLEDKRLVEIHREQAGKGLAVGDIYLGKVKKIAPGHNAAFVDVGTPKDGFLHYTDLGPKVQSFCKYVSLAISGKQPDPLLKNTSLEPDIIKTGKMADVLNKQEVLLVQVLKEPIASKGPRLTCEVTLAGSYIVLAPFSETVSISRKIRKKEERERLSRVVESIKPEKFGIIVRTAANGRTVAELHADITAQLERWEQILGQVAQNRPPKRVLSEEGRTSQLLRDLLNNEVSHIYVDDKQMASQLKEQLRKQSNGQEKAVNYYSGQAPVFEHFKVTRQINASFGKNVKMASGAELVIETTEAMHVVDVNSGTKIGHRGQTQATNALTTNLEAVEEIARQIRLRDLGGLIVIDFIDMKDPEHRQMVQRRMKEALSNDRSQHEILPLSRFCLMQITRERTRQELDLSVSETCPSCKGTGKIKNTSLIIDEIENSLGYMLNELDYQNLRVIVHPFVEAYIKRGIISLQWKWFWKFKKWVPVTADSHYTFTQYRFYDGPEEELKQ